MGLLDTIKNTLGLGDAPSYPMLYSKVSLYIDGKLLAQTTKISVKMEAHSSEIETLDMGFAGVSPGGARVVVSVSEAVPAADFEIRPMQSSSAWRPTEKDKVEDKTVELTVLAAHRHLTTLGWFRSWDLEYSAGGLSTLSFEFVGFSREWN